jgi:hypothetical protein
VKPRLKYFEAANDLATYGWSPEDPWFPRMKSKDRQAIALHPDYQKLPRQDAFLIIHTPTNMAVPRHEPQFVNDQREHNKPKWQEVA